MKRKYKSRDSIIKSCANLALPISLMLGSYIILHGHLSPGGGFQGGVLIAGVVSILFIAYGPSEIKKVFNSERIKVSEDIGAIGFIILATLGIIYGITFFQNVLSHGTPGKLYSAGTIFWMNFAVGYKVLAGVGFLIIVMLSSLYQTSEYEDDDDNK
ncbi:MAG: MnhB domain-containing protein [Clostridiaceae bacterium]